MVAAMDSLTRTRLITKPGRFVLERAPEGFDALVMAEALAEAGGRGLFVARDDRRADAAAAVAAFFGPGLEIVRLPAWDCQPYDRVSPSPAIAAQRTAALRRLADADGARPVLVIATASAVLQRCAPRAALKAAAFAAKPGDMVDLDALKRHLAENGYVRAGQVTEPGDYAIRGGVVDVFPPGRDEPVRLDFFGDTLESVRAFAPDTQRTTKQLKGLNLAPVSEALLTADAVTRFRRGYVAAFGAVTDSDPVYEAVSAGARAQGVEHWLSLFHERLETVFEYVGPQALVFLDHLAERAAAERQDLIADYFAARRDAVGAGSGEGAFDAPAYRALEPAALYLEPGEWADALAARRTRAFSAFADDARDEDRIDLGARPGREFSAERKSEGANVFEVAAGHMRALQSDGKRVVIACWTEGSSERTASVFADHGMEGIAPAADWPAVSTLAANTIARAVLPLERGFETDALAVISEQDVLGDRLTRQRRPRKAANFIAEAASLSPGDLVVHVDHGVGRYCGLRTLEVQSARQDCLELHYADDAKLFLPVENIELLSRYGSEDGAAVLDRLGGASWQHRKAKAKKRLRDMAAQLIAVAAKRAAGGAEPITAPSGLYEEFAARFPYAETDDQLHAIDDTLEDLASDKVMDRLICGDVGFGKTEVALRAAFVAAINGAQVAVISPTTLLSRQHVKTFTERFRGWPIKIAQLSRLVTGKEATAVKKGLAEGRVDVVIGTHALLSKTVSIKDLGLLIIDEEQHFGVRHKERLKELKVGVNVLTLTATPIPRTLQMSLAGIRDLSIIATPPVDRLAVRTYVAPFDPVTIREALLRERYRGGQSFVVCPRIKDLPDAEEFLKERAPELSYVVAHGQMAPTELEERVNAFYEGRYDVLLSTSIVESGIDIPTANTLVVYRADMFGLAQLYQLRGRVGRSKTRAYAYLTIPATWTITPAAEKRLKVLSSLDTLGAGFTLASHDLDLRGGGNLLGEEQSGHIKDVGVELFQSMLEEAIAAVREDPDAGEAKERWSPQINLGVTVLIPEEYVPDLDLRLGLYRRLSNLETQSEREGFAAELIDRFGPLPEEVANLMDVIALKALCRRVGAAKIDAGPKGAVVHFRDDAMDDPAPLVAMVARRPQHWRLRPDQTLFIAGDWPDPPARLRGLKRALGQLAEALAPGPKDAEAVDA